MTYYNEDSNEFMSVVIDYLCRAYQTDCNGLADLIGCNRGWFTRYRKADFGNKGCATTMALLKLAANVEYEQLISALFNE